MSSETMSFDLLPFTVEALGFNKDIYADIDSLFQKDKYTFYKAAREHYLYRHQIVTEGSLLQEEYCKKALGILLCANDNEEITKGIFDLFRKGWTYAYLFVNNNDEIDLVKFMKNITRKIGNLDKVSDDWLNSQILAVYFLALNTEKPIVKNDIRINFEQILFERWKHYEDDNPFRISLNNTSKELHDKVKELKKQIFECYGRFYNYSGMYGKLNKRAEAMALLYDYEKLSCESVFNTVGFKESDIDEILLAYITRYPELDINLAADFLCDSIYVRYMIKAYKMVKQRYFENNKETAYIELEGMEKKLDAAKQENIRLSALLAEAQNEIKILEKENSKLKSELVQEKKNRQELNSLREFLFSLDLQEEYKDAQSVNLNSLKDFKAVVIGGHERWQTQMKDMLPCFTFIHPDNKSFDIRILNNIPVVFVYVNYLNHSIYYRAMKAIEGTETKIYYINQKNINLVLNDIYRIYQSEKREC